MTSLHDPVAADQLRLTVEMGDEYTPSARVAAALNELSAALEEADESHVDGFGMDVGSLNLKHRSFAFDSLKIESGWKIASRDGRGDGGALWNGKDKFPG